MRRLAVVQMAVVALGWCSAAGASSIVYSCGDAVCRVNADGSGLSTIAAGRTYRSPSISLDGKHLAWIEPTADLFTGSGSGASPVGPISRFAIQTIMRPDGTQVLAFEGAGQPGRICVYAIAGGSCDSQAGGAVTSAGWMPDGSVMIDTRDSSDPAFTGKSRYYNNTICVLKPHGGDTGGECDHTVAHAADSQLSDPAASPDGATIAVAAAPWDNQDATRITLFAADGSGSPRALSAGPGDATPAWSPDGRLIAFSRDGGIWVVPSDGSAAERRIADGTGPSWTNASAGSSTPSLKVSAEKTQHGPTVRGTLTVPKAGAKVIVELIAKSGQDLVLVGKSTHTAAKAGRQAFSATLTKKVQKALRSVRKLPLIVRVTVKRSGAAAVSVTRNVTLLLR